jgi:hypothetical protein
MPKNRKPHEQRKPEDYREAADNSLGLAKVLAGQGGISDQDFLDRMARSADLVDHDGEACGLCHNMILGAQVAREMIEAGQYEDVVGRWAEEAKRRWEDSKFFKLWEEGKKAGRDPRKAFKDRGGSHERQLPCLARGPALGQGVRP